MNRKIVTIAAAFVLGVLATSGVISLTVRRPRMRKPSVRSQRQD